MSERKEHLAVGVRKLTAKKPKRELKEISESKCGTDKTWTWKTYEGPQNSSYDEGFTDGEELARLLNKTEIQLMLIKQNAIMRNQIILALTVFMNTLSVLLLCYLIKSL